MNEQAQMLEALLTSPGWRAFREHVYQEWGPSGEKYQAELDKALDLTNNDAAASQARQIKAAQKAIQHLLEWPADELGRLKRAERPVEPVMSRRGGL